MTEVNQHTVISRLIEEVTTLKKEVNQLKTHQMNSALALPTIMEGEKVTSRRHLLKRMAVATAGIAATSVALATTANTASADATGGGGTVNTNSSAFFGLTVAPSGAPLLQVGVGGPYGIITRSDSTAPNLTNSCGITSTSAGIGGVFKGDLAALRLVKTASTSGPPVTGTHNEGEFYVDVDGSLFYCIKGGTGLLTPPSTTGAAWVVLATDRTRSIRFLDEPFRVKIVTTGAELLPGAPGTPTAANTVVIPITVGDLPTNSAGIANPIPDTARGLVGALTNINTTSPGNIRLWPAGGTIPSTNNLNLPPGPTGAPLNTTTAFTSRIGNPDAGTNARKLALAYSSGVANARSGYAIDVTGYYIQ